MVNRLALTPATTSQLVGELLGAGLVRREVDSADRRRALVSIDPDLAPEVAAVADRRLQPFRDALAGLRPNERAVFRRGWQLLIDAHDQQATTGSQDPRRRDTAR